MESRTERLLRALGNREAFAVVIALMKQEMTTSNLSKTTSLSLQTVESTIEVLSQASVVSRRPGSQGAWFVLHWPETFALLDTARKLGVAIQGSEDRSTDDERELFDRFEGVGGAAPAAARGRP